VGVICLQVHLWWLLRVAFFGGLVATAVNLQRSLHIHVMCGLFFFARDGHCCLCIVLRARYALSKTHDVHPWNCWSVLLVLVSLCSSISWCVVTRFAIVASIAYHCPSHTCKQDAPTKDVGDYPPPPVLASSVQFLSDCCNFWHFVSGVWQRLKCFPFFVC